MPECKKYRGRKVRNARRLTRNGVPMIRITFEASKGEPGPQVEVTPEEYDREVIREFVPGTGKA